MALKQSRHESDRDCLGIHEAEDKPGNIDIKAVIDQQNPGDMCERLGNSCPVE